MQKSLSLRLIIASIFGALVTGLFVFLGAPILRAVRLSGSATLYWTLGIAISGALAATHPSMQIFSLLILSHWILVGLYSELEIRGWVGFWPAAVSVLVSSAGLIGGVYVWSRSLGVPVESVIQEGIQGLLSQMKTKSIDASTIVQQMPSLVIVTMMISMGFALMLDQKMSRLLGLPIEKVAGRMRLLEFKVPDFFIWVAMISFLLSFAKIEPLDVKIVAMNILNVVGGLYFFQGLAILEVAFLVFRTGFLTKFLVYFFIVGQLFFVLSAVGFGDYWLNLRDRLKKIGTSQKDRKEHV